MLIKKVLKISKILVLLNKRSLTKLNKQKTMKYITVEEKNKTNLEKEVQSLIDKGWEPLGGMCVDAVGTGSSRFFQALIFEG